MKTLKSSVSLCLLACSMFFSTSIFATTPNAKDLSPQQSLKKRIISLLDKPELEANGIEKETVTIAFTLNENDRIELSSIGTENEYLKNYLKRCLQKEKAFTQGLTENETHQLTLIFVSE